MTKDTGFTAPGGGGAKDKAIEAAMGTYHEAWAVWRSQVPHPDKKYNLAKFFAERMLEAAAPHMQEREAIVKWLRRRRSWDFTDREIAEQIERGDHRSQAND